MVGNLRFKIDWASLTVGRKFTVFALYYFVFEGNFQVQDPRGLILILEGPFNGCFFCVTSLGGLYLEELRHGGAYFWNYTGPGLRLGGINQKKSSRGSVRVTVYFSSLHIMQNRRLTLYFN